MSSTSPTTITSARSVRPENTTLCLACSSSLPPRADSTSIFRTRCCARPICSACLAHNPRLARYNPCLACLSGVRAAGSSARPALAGGRAVNVNAEVREEDVFALGSDGEEGAEGAEDGEESRALDVPADAKSGASARPAQAPPPPDGPPAGLDVSTPLQSQDSRALSPTPGESPASPPPASPSPTPSVYHLKPSDTLHGLALRFGVPARTLCTLNNLPFSTLSTTPHLLHTRTSIVLSASAPSADGAPLNGSDPAAAERNAEEQEEETERRRRWVREQAEKRLQVLTKEVDWRVARAYVALAEDGPPEADEEAAALRALKAKEAGLPAPPVRAGLEGRAIDAYLEDEEWEASVRAEGALPGRRVSPTSTSKEVKEQEAKVLWGIGRLW